MTHNSHHRDATQDDRGASKSILIIGVGNETRRDDAAGLLVSRALASLELPDVTVREISGEGAALMDAWQGAEVVIVVDAVSSGSAPGKLYRFHANREPLPSAFFHYSTHAFSVAEAVELARVLEQLPPQLIVYGIEGADFGHGIGVSQPVRAAVEEAATAIARDLGDLTGTPRPGV